MSLASPCFDVSDHTAVDLKRLMALSLDMKIVYSLTRIQEFFIQQKGKVYVSFSGGKDSTVLLDLVRSKYPNIPAVFFDTGLEFPEIRDHVKRYDNVTWLKPEMSFRKVIETYGYPCIGKMPAHWIDLAQRGQPSGIRQMNADTKFGYKKYNFMVDAPFKVSERCCDMMKKKPAMQYYKDTGRCPYIGTRTSESVIRRDMWVKEGDNREGNKYPMSNPLSIWTDKDIDDYIARKNIKLAEVYNMGYPRTGCVFCMFGIMSDKNRFIKLKATHPQLWEYCMKPWDQGGLGMKEVLDYMDIPTGCEQQTLF